MKTGRKSLACAVALLLLLTVPACGLISGPKETTAASSETTAAVTYTDEEISSILLKFWVDKQQKAGAGTDLVTTIETSDKPDTFVVSVSEAQEDNNVAYVYYDVNRVTLTATPEEGYDYDTLDIPTLVSEGFLP